IDPLAIEVDDVVVGGNEDVDLRMPLPKTRETRNEPKGRERLIRRDGERASALVSANAAHRLSELVQNDARRGVQRMPRARQPQLAVAALEQRRSELLLERRDLSRKRRLREEELLRRAGERQVARGGVETFQEIERRQLGVAFGVEARGFMH